MAVGERVEPWHIVELLSHPEGGLKGVPPEAEVRIILNKTEAIDRLEQGRVIAESLLSSPEVQAIVLANVIRDPSVREVIGRVAGIVLAAGGSTRLKQLKQLVQWRSRSLVWHVVQAALGGGLSPIIVVVGAQAERVRQVLADQPVAIIDNPSWECGLSSSLRIGLKAVEERVEAVVVLLADMPFIREDLVKVLIQGHRLSQSPLIAPQAGGRRANPVLFDRATFPSLHGLSGDRGGRELFERFPSILVPWDESILFDVDTIEDLRQLEEME
jgi:molybdenum cofactor cytidylyltransferase